MSAISNRVKKLEKTAGPTDMTGREWSDLLCMITDSELEARVAGYENQEELDPFAYKFTTHKAHALAIFGSWPEIEPIARKRYAEFIKQYPDSRRRPWGFEFSQKYDLKGSNHG